MGLQGVLAVALTILTTAVTVVVGSSRLDVIDLPVGFFPEGIALGEGWTVYVGSLLEGK